MAYVVLTLLYRWTLARIPRCFAFMDLSTLGDDAKRATKDYRSKRAAFFRHPFDDRNPA